MVFYHHEIAPAPDRLPRYLDLGYYAQEQRHAVHVFVELAARAARRGETRELGKTLCGNGRMVGVAAFATGGNGLRFDWQRRADFAGGHHALRCRRK